MSSIPNWLSQRALQKSHHPTLLFEGKTLTFADLEAISTSMAFKLAEMGIESGICVAILMSNRPGYTLLLYALSKIGAIAALINMRLSAQEIEWQLQDCQAQLLVYDRTTNAISAQLQTWRSLDITELEGVTANTSSPLLTDIELEAVQAIIYTSGTTGVPKGVQLTYGNHWHSAVASAMNLGVDQSDRWLLCLWGDWQLCGAV
jgi:O-succinylbenzoic acid--CoA ligase